MSEEWKTKYKHSNDRLKPNKKCIKQNTLYFDDGGVDELNKILDYCKANYTFVPCTRSRGISNITKYRFKERYSVSAGNEFFEVIIICLEGLYKFVLKNRPGKGNTIKGQTAVKEIYNKAREMNLIDTLSNLKSSPANGAKIKEEIVSPHIQYLLPESHLGKRTRHCYHLDYNSAYASEISKFREELRPMYEYFYNHRKDDNDYYKHVLTNSIGCFQSEFCPNIDNPGVSSSYQLSILSKVAVNGTRKWIETMIKKLEKAGMVPILTNTDGIWYHSDYGAYHDENEGLNLGQWKTDHSDVTLLIKSKGAYQYLENGICKTVVRGRTDYDLVKERVDWEFGAILKEDLRIEKYKFNKEKGVIEKIWLNM